MTFRDTLRNLLEAMDIHQMPPVKGFSKMVAQAGFIPIVNQMVWVITSATSSNGNPNVVKCRVVKIIGKFWSENYCTFTVRNMGYEASFKSSAIGKKVFFTLEEADEEHKRMLKNKKTRSNYEDSDQERLL